MPKCPKCSEKFVCGCEEGKGTCWCFHIGRVEVDPEFEGKGCLCPKCLGASDVYKDVGWTIEEERRQKVAEQRETIGRLLSRGMVDDL